jgi:hypothetical protein
MQIAAANLTGDFTQVTPEQIRTGEVLNEGVLQTPEETTVPSIPDGGPGWSIPDITLPGGPRPTTPGRTTTTTDPDDTTTTTGGGGPPSTSQGPGAASP